MLPTKRIYYPFIDILKAIAICFVVFYHNFFVVINPDFRMLGDYLKYLFYTVLGIGVPLFFTVNGFLVFQKKCNLKKHILKTFKIIIITGIWGVFSLILLMILRNDKFYVISFFNDLISLKQGYINYLWFMEALVFLYLLYPLLEWIYRKYFHIFQIILIGVIIYTILIPTGCSISKAIVGDMKDFYIIKILNSFPGIYFLFSLSYFMMGGMIYKFSSNIKIKKKKGILLGILFFLMIVIQTLLGVLESKNTGTVFDNVWNGYDSIFIYIGTIIIFVIYFCYDKQKKACFVEKIGINSLGIYFIHPILIAIIMKIPEIKLVYSNVIINFISSIFITIISFYITIFLKKIPLLKKLVEL